ncbi:hypothetical protein PIOMA14_II_0350 [Prevotella intermedia]|uniref:Uncharacterized protein n=1 Tax=Prevotella intermedia TaxID=28131 RepID=A0A0T7AP65_PREIN|nr:hypothetical protein PIOMA14_II_0350 [Prevotella intermedia]
METGKIRLDVYKHETSANKEKSPEPHLYIVPVTLSIVRVSTSFLCR